jgi:hypothetical protein
MFAFIRLMLRASRMTVDALRSIYLNGRITLAQLNALVADGLLTQEQFDQVTAP